MARIHSLKNIYLLGTRPYSCCIGVNEVYILAGARTPIGCFQGKFTSLTAVELATKALSHVLEKSEFNKDDIQEVIVGNCLPSGLGQSPAHQIAQFCGLSNSTVCYTINKVCGSGLKSIMNAYQTIVANINEVVVAGGMESTTHAPFLLKRKNLRLGNVCLSDTIFHDGLIDMIKQVDVTYFAEETVKEYGYNREGQDEFALGSYAKSAAAQENNVFAAEMAPVVLKGKKGEEEVVKEDEEVKRLKVEKFRDLVPDIGKGGTITVGNSSGLHDGAAMMILASGNYVLKKNITPMARIVSFADVNVDPKKFVVAPSVAIPKALVRANLTVDHIHRWEISETFAVTTMLTTKILNINPDLVNKYGGAISLGHPFGMTGSRLIIHLAHTLECGQLGCASICHAGGGGLAMIIEKMK